MKTFFIIAFGLHAYVCCAQVVEHFTDENFSSNPLWTGTSSHFIVNASQQLQLNNTVAGTSYLSTPFTADSIDGFEWEVYVKQAFAPSGSNFGRIYLVSDQSNLTSALNGYYLQLGEAGSLDAVELFRQSGSVHASVCRATNAAIALSLTIRVRVTRSGAGVWSLYIDYSGGTSFGEEAHGTDTTFSEASYFGVACVYTASNANKFFFDDLLAGPPLGDLSPPLLTGFTVVSQSELRLDFSEALDSASTSAANFLVSDSIGNPMMVELLNEQKSIRLTFSSAFLNGKLYTLSITGIADLSSNEMPPEAQPFRYFVPEPALNGDIIFNELFTDPSPVIGLPAFEFVEVFNKSDKAFNLSNWTLSDLTSTATLPSTFILPGEYLVITATGALSLYEPFGTTISIANMPTLNNTSDVFVLRDTSGNAIDSVGYSLSWFQDEDKQLGGYTLERLLPDLETNEPLNWMASEAVIGGTPGSPNSVLGRNPDSKAPRVDTLIVVNQNTLALIFNEAIDTVSLQPSMLRTGRGLIPSMVRIISHVVVELGFADYFVNGADDDLVITGITDVAGNVIDTTDLAFRYFVPGPISPGVLLINEIMADPSPTVFLPEAEYIEVINTSGTPFDLLAWTLTDATDTVKLPSGIIMPHEHLVLTSTTNASKFSEYGRHLGVPGFPSLTNTGEPLTLRSPTGVMIDSVFYHQTWLGGGEKADGGWSLERLDPDVVSFEPTNWRVSIDSLGGTPARRNSVAGMNPDSKSPTLDSLDVTSEWELDLTFNEPMDSVANTAVEHYSVNGTQPADATVSSPGAVSLRFDSAFANGVEQQLLVSGLRDLAGNILEPTEMSFRYFVPGEICAGIVMINEIMADPSPVVQLPEAEYIEVVNTTASPFDLDGWRLMDATDTVTLPFCIILPHEYLVLTSTANAPKFSGFGPHLGVPGFPLLTNSGEPLTLRSPGGLKIDSVFYRHAWLGESEKADGGWSLERLDLLVTSDEPTNWRASVDTLGGTPARANSVAGMNPDLVAPTLDSLFVQGDLELELIFSEQMDSVVGTNTEHYSVGGRRPSIATKSQNGAAISLRFDTAFENGVDQQLLVSGLMDLAGNDMDSTTLPFRYFAPGEIAAGVLLINEIMADPSPTVQLPEAEYIEVVNTSDSPIDVQGWTLTDAIDTVALPFGIILPHEYLVLTSTTNAPKFSDYGRHLGVTGFPSLTNSGEPLTLRSSGGLKIDSVFYHQTWLGESEKADGGWSLERLDLGVVSDEPTNWRASIDTLGGTPGRRNSVAGMNPDLKSPMLDSLLVRSNLELHLTFSEPIDSLTASDVMNYAVDGRHPTDAAISSLGARISLRFDTEFANGADQQLLVFGLRDLAGNGMDTTAIPFRYFVAGEITTGVVLINEIMADPSPTVQLPEAEYIEIVNTSDFPFDLQGWTLTDASDTVTLPGWIILPYEYLLLTSITNAPKFSDYGRHLDIPGFTSLTNSGEPLILRSPGGMKIDSVFYHQTWIGDPEKADGGWSLERLDLAVSSVEPTNWRASVDTLGGTPARMNSVAGMNPDLELPSLDSLFVRSDLELALTFSEPIDSLAASNVGNYSVAGRKPAVATLSGSGSEIFLHFDSGFANGVEQHLLVSGLKDLAGNEMDSTAVAFRYFVPGEIGKGVLLINEIMADPSPTVQLPEAEYIEVVNTSSSPFDLHGWTLTDATDTITLPAAIILRREYLVLASTTNALKFSSYGPSLGIPGFPSLANSGEPLTLRSPAGMMIDSVFYRQAWLGESEKADGGWSLERLDLLVASNEPTNWRASIDTLGGTPGRVNSVEGMNPDLRPPALDSLLVRSDRELDLIFNETIDSLSSSNVLNYSADGRQPADATVSGPGRISIRFDTAFANGVDQELVVTGLKDLAGNELLPTATSFRYFVTGEISAGVVLINEIMADPSPVVLLPEAEYIEVINTSDAPFDLQGWTLTDAMDTVTLPMGIILPHQYLLLTSVSSTLNFSDYGRCLGVPGFPSLTNGGEPLILRSQTGIKIDSVNYSQTWLGEGQKADGGWSIERLDVAVVSIEPTNWRASVDTLGGTPARQNSVAGMNPDSRPPKLDSLLVRNDRELDLMFNEPIDSLSSSNVLNYSADCGQPRDATLSGPGRKITLRFDSAFANGIDQPLLVSGLTDLAGNEMEPTEMSFRYFVTGEIRPGVVLINEIMADPTPVIQLPEAEYIELVNISDSPFDLQGWTLTDATDTVGLPGAIILPHEFLVLTSTTNAAKFSNYGRNLAVPGFPSLTNSGEPLTLRSPAALKIDSVFYHQAWLGENEKVDGGWSLERLSWSVVSFEPTNWRASIDTSGGTPARANSVAGMNPDLMPPTLDSLLVLNDRELQLIFSEPMDSVGANIGHYSIDGIQPADAALSSPGTKMSLRFDEAFENGVDRELFVSGLKDLAGNELLPTATSFRYFVPGEVTPGVVLINEIMADPSPVVQLPEAEYIEIVNTSDSPFDLQGWTLTDATGAVALPAVIILPNEYLVLTSTINAVKFSDFGRLVGVPGFPSLTNSGEPLTLRAPGKTKVDSVFYQQTWLGDGGKADGGWSLERLSLSVPSNDPTNWRASIDTLGGTPARANSVEGMNPDSKPPTLDSLLVRSSHELDLVFSEAIDNDFGRDVQNYFLEGKHPLLATVAQEGRKISLDFARAFENGLQQQLVVSGMRDVAGNEMQEEVYSFMYFSSGAIVPGVVLINEIMADPAPVVNLPEAEFIEIVNVASGPFSLQRWTLSDATTTCLLPGVIIQPGAFLILTSISNALKFDTSRLVVGVTGFPSLNNSGEPIQLRSPDGRIVDSVQYDIRWFGDDPKQDGGWTLERLRYNFSSTAQINWRPSLDLRGGTPGTINSQVGKNPDDRPPKMVSALVANAHTIELRFDEPIDQKAVGTLIRIDSADFDTIEWSWANEVHCMVDSDLENGGLHTLSVVGVRDTAGNVMPAEELILRYFVPSDVAPKDIIINEIMPDPSPMVGLPDAEYVELLNRSPNPINLQGWELADANTTAVLTDRIIMAGEFLVLAEAEVLHQRNSFVVAGLPSLSNDEDYLVLRTPRGARVDSINYNKSWYRASDKSDGGWSLELIDPMNPCGEQDNWAACEDESGGTPGKMNSVQASKPDVDGPGILRVVVESPRLILVEFDEKLSEGISNTSLTLTPAVGRLSVAFADATLRTIKVTLDDELKMSTPYLLTVANLFDCNGNRIRDQHSTYSFTLPEDPLDGDIVINEVLFNPRPGGPDFIEIYNKGSRYVDLKSWWIARTDEVAGDTESIGDNRILAPYNFLVFTSDRDRLLSDYPQAPGEVIMQASLPSMPDDHAAIAIGDSRNHVLDSLTYDEGFHSPLISDPEGVSLERISMAVGASERSNWRSATESAGFATPGQVNSNSRGDRDKSADEFFVSPEIISPSSAENFAMIFYRFTDPGNFINCRVFDQQGHLVKVIANNLSTGLEGFLRWDGDTEEGSSARAGYYLILLDYFDTESAAHSVRMRVVVAPR